MGKNYQATSMKTWNDLFLHTVCKSSFHFQVNPTLVSIHFVTNRLKIFEKSFQEEEKIAWSCSHESTI